jgi:methyl coenzyme M reductase subunit C
VIPVIQCQSKKVIPQEVDVDVVEHHLVGLRNASMVEAEEIVEGMVEEIVEGMVEGIVEVVVEEEVEEIVEDVVEVAEDVEVSQLKVGKQQNILLNAIVFQESSLLEEPMMICW